MAAVHLRNNRPTQMQLPRKLSYNTPLMVSASASPGTTGTAYNDKSASFGQRRQRGFGSHRTARESGLKKVDDGGFTLSWIPSNTRDSGKPEGKPNTKRPGIEYLGAGLERGVERLNNLSEAERKGRSERRKNVRSGSKNVFRKL